MTDEEIDRDLDRLGDLLVWGTTDPGTRARIWQEVRRVHAMRSKRRVREMERAQGIAGLSPCAVLPDGIHVITDGPGHSRGQP